MITHILFARKLMVLLSSYSLCFLCLEGAPQTEEVVGKTKLYAANGIVKGVIAEFESYPDPDKKMLLFHRSGEFNSYCLVWAISYGNNIMVGRFSGQEDKHQQWNGAFFQKEKNKLEYMRYHKIFDKCQKLVEKIGKHKKRADTNQDIGIVLDFYLGNGKDELFHIKSTKGDDDLENLRKKIKIESDNLIKILPRRKKLLNQERGQSGVSPQK